MKGKLEKKYFINQRMLFGLESMRDKCTYLLECEDLSTEDYNKFFDLREECENLLCEAGGKVDSKTYGRILEITKQREYMRYVTCLNAGMDERDAALALED